MAEKETKTGCLGSPMERKEKKPEGKNYNLPLEKILAVVEELPPADWCYGEKWVHKCKGKCQKRQRLECERKIQREKCITREEGTEGKANHPHTIEQPVTKSLFFFSARFKEKRIERNLKYVHGNTKEKEDNKKGDKVSYSPL
jgi:hypothetical protein